MYLIPASIRAITATTATYLIPSEITRERIHITLLHEAKVSDQGHPGSHLHAILGSAAKVTIT